MKSRLFESRAAWLVVGAVFGVAVSLYWPTEQVQATSVDRASKIALITSDTTAGNSDAVFVLDFVTGRLVGGAYSTNTGRFNQMYVRNLARDFQVSENAQYAIVPGRVAIPQRGGGTPANGGIFVAELNSGKVAMYGFPYNQTAGPQPVQTLVPIDFFSFREVQE